MLFTMRITHKNTLDMVMWKTFNVTPSDKDRMLSPPHGWMPPRRAMERSLFLEKSVWIDFKRRISSRTKKNPPARRTKMLSYYLKRMSSVASTKMTTLDKIYLVTDCIYYSESYTECTIRLVDDKLNHRACAVDSQTTYRQTTRHRGISGCLPLSTSTHQRV